MVSYGLAYGMEAYGLSQRLGVAVEEAKAILDAVLRGLPVGADVHGRAVAEARANGYTETLSGAGAIARARLANHRVRLAAERQAMNAGIQGLAADMFKMALVRLDGALEDRGLRSDSCSRSTTRSWSSRPGRGRGGRGADRTALTGAAVSSPCP